MEEGTAHGQGLAEQAVGLIDEVLGGMREKSEQIERKQHGGKMLLAMPKVMFKVIALVFEDIDGLIFDFPARRVPSGRDLCQRRHGL